MDNKKKKHSTTRKKQPSSNIGSGVATTHHAIGNWMVRLNKRMIALCTREDDATKIAGALNAPNAPGERPATGAPETPPLK